MSNNAAILILNIKKQARDSGLKRAADIQKRIATLYLMNLMKFTNIKTGRLAGGWTVRLRRSGGNKRASKNNTRKPNKKQLAPIDKINGRGSVTVVNSVAYAAFVDKGTRYQPASNFTRKAALVTARQLKLEGININSGGAS